MPRKKKYGKLEEYIINTLKKERTFCYEGAKWNVVLVDKPRPQENGECKTDVYVLAETNGLKKEFKISVKMSSSHEFQENKIKKERAESIFGSDYKNIIRKTAKKIEKEFDNQFLLFQKEKHPTKINSITMGWKLELATKPRKLSAKLELSDKEIKEYIYKGKNLAKDKKDSLVNGNVIKDSGVAEYILYMENDEKLTSDEIIQKLIPIDEMKIEPMYLIFTANNFRTDKETKKESSKSTDGKRSLAVKIKWKNSNGKLDYHLDFENPLSETGFDNKKETLKVLNELHLFHPENMKEEQIKKSSILYKD